MVFDSEIGRKFGAKGLKSVRRAKAARRRKAELVLLTPEEVEVKLGVLETVDDARRWLGLVGLWGCQGKLAGGVASATNRSVEVWLKALEADHTRELVVLRTRVKELEKQLRGSVKAY